VDDSLDIFAQHGVGGIVGLLTNAFFASHSVITLDGVSTNKGGWVDRNWKQFYIQAAYIIAACSYTFVVTALLAHYINTVPGLHLRTTAEGEALGSDEVQVGLDIL
jgi:ammonium transporter, Amt family